MTDEKTYPCKITGDLFGDDRKMIITGPSGATRTISAWPKSDIVYNWTQTSAIAQFIVGIYERAKSGQGTAELTKAELEIINKYSDEQINRKVE